MTTGKKIAVIVVSYLAIGGVIGLTQLGMSKVMAPPPCNGLPVYTLLENFRRSIDIDELLQNRKQRPESLPSYYFRFGRSLTLWLPDHLQEITDRDMSLRNYAMGGFRCVNYPFTSSSQSLPSQESGNKRFEDHDAR
jgi:hypothetical protein